MTSVQNLTAAADAGLMELFEGDWLDKLVQAILALEK